MRHTDHEGRTFMSYCQTGRKDLNIDVICPECIDSAELSSSD